MGKYKKLIVFVMLFAELMWILQPYSVLAKNNHKEKYNQEGNEEVTILSEAEIENLGDIDQEYQVVLPDDNQRSVFLSEYLDEKNKKEKKVKINETSEDGTDTNEKDKKDKKDKKSKVDDEIIIVDNDIEENDTKSSKKEYKNKSNTFNGFLPESLDYSNPIRLEFGKTKVTYIPMFYTFHNAVTSHNQVTYYTDRRNTVFNYYFTNDSFKEEIVILGPQDTYRFDYRLTVEKGSLLEENGRIFILGNNKKKLFELKAPVAVDAVGNKIENLELTLTELDNSYNVKLNVDSEWMNDNERIFPVIIDPEFNLVASDTDTYINENVPDTEFYDSTVLKIGSEVNENLDNKINRSFFSFDRDLYNKIQDEAISISDSYLNLTAVILNEPAVQNMDVCALDSAVDFNGLNWTNGNNLNSTCFPVTTTTTSTLSSFTNLFDDMDLSGKINYTFETDVELEEGSSYNPINNNESDRNAEISKIFDNDESSLGALYIHNGEYLVDQEIVINLDEYIGPEEIRIVFGGSGDCSNEVLSIEFKDTLNSENSYSEILSNGMSSMNLDEDDEESEIEKDKYELSKSFEPSSSMYNQIVLKLHSDSTNASPVIYEFEVTKYEAYEYKVKIPLTSYLNEVIIDDTMENHGFFVKMTDETDSAVAYSSNDSGEDKPEIYVDYERIDGVSKYYPLEDIVLNVNPVVDYNNTTANFDTISFNGIATPDNSEQEKSTVTLYLNKINFITDEGEPDTQDILDDEGNVIGTLNAKEAIYDGVQLNTISQSYGDESKTYNYSFPSNFPEGFKFEFNKLYVAEAEVVRGTESARTSESFMIAELSFYTNIADLAFFYGVDTQTLREDNNITGELDINSKVFIRNPKRNIGEAYTSASIEYLSEQKDNDYLLGLNSLNEYFENKVNINTGNYYLSHTDMSYMMLGEEVEIKRIYNSMNTSGVHEFGQSWDYNFNYKLVNYEDDKLVFKKEDGQKIYFEKDGSNYITQNNDYHKLSAISDGYKITGKDRTYIFNSSGQITKLAFDSGDELEYEYENDRLNTIVLQNEDELLLEYSETGLIRSLSYVAVEYTENEYKKRTIASTIEYSYTNDCLTEVTDPIGFTTNYNYDDLGRITSWTNKNPDEDKVKIDEVVYDEENRILSLTNAKGVVNSFEYFKFKGYTDWKQKVGDGQSEQIKRVRYNDSFKTTSVTFNDGSKISKEYGDNGQISVETLMNGTTLTYSYDDNNNVTEILRSDNYKKSFGYDDNDNMLFETVYYPEDETEIESYKTKYSYKAADTSGEYTNLLEKTTYPDSTDNNPIETQNDYIGSQIKSTIDENGNITEYLYDSKKRLSEVIYPNNEVIRYKYNLMGYVSKETKGTFTKGSGEEPDTFTDKASRIISRNYRNEIVYETSFEGDITQTYYDGNGNILSIADGNYHITNYSYNSTGELEKEVRANHYYTEFTYDSFGNEITKTSYDSNGGSEYKYPENKYDSQQRIIEIIYPNTNYEKYQYNLSGEMERKIKGTCKVLTSESDCENQDYDELVTVYRYDPYVNEVTQEYLPDGNYITRDYDVNGNLKNEIDIYGNKVGYEYDIRNRLISETHDNGLLIEYAYDNNGNLLSEKESEINPDSKIYYTDWSDWELASNNEGVEDPVLSKTQYRSKEYKTVWVTDTVPEGFESLGNYEAISDVNYSHTTNFNFSWSDGLLGITDLYDGRKKEVHGYKDYDYLDACRSHNLGTDSKGTYCKKFKYYFVKEEYEGYSYPDEEEIWKDTEIVENENNIVETRIVYSTDNGVSWSETADVSRLDTDLIDYEILNKKKFYSVVNTENYNDWSETKPENISLSANQELFIEEKYEYRERELVGQEYSSTEAYIEGYEKIPGSKVILEDIAGYLHTNTLGQTWSNGFLGEFTYNNHNILLEGYKDPDYLEYGRCNASYISNDNDGKGDYCKKTRFYYIEYKFNQRGDYGDWQTDKIVDDGTNDVETREFYRYEIREFTPDYRLISDDNYVNESDRIEKETYVRTRQQLIIPEDEVLDIIEDSDNNSVNNYDLLTGVSAKEIDGTDIDVNTGITVYVNGIEGITSIDQETAGTYEVEYRLNGTDLKVIRHIEVIDNLTGFKTTSVEFESRTEIDKEGVIASDSTDYIRYLNPSGTWSAYQSEHPGNDPADGNYRLVEEEHFYKTRDTEVYGPSANPPQISNEIYYTEFIDTIYTESSKTVLNWDSLDEINIIHARGGEDNEPIDETVSKISGYWGTTYHGSGYYAKYDHWRSGKHFIYKYGTKYSGYTTVFKVTRYTYDFEDLYNYHYYTDWSNWQSNGANPYSDQDTDLLENKVEFRYIDGNIVNLEASSAPESGYIKIGEYTNYNYSKNLKLEYQKYDSVNVGETKDFTDLYTFTDPTNENPEETVSIKIMLNDTVVAETLTDNTYTFTTPGLYTAVYSVKKGEETILEATQQIDVEQENESRIKTYTYNNMNQISSSTDAEGNVSKYDYENNNLTSKRAVTETAGEDIIVKSENYVYNCNNQLISVNIKDSNGITLSEISYEYDGVGNKISETDIYGNKTEYVYDEVDQLKIVSKPTVIEGNAANAITQYQYDAGGRLIKETNPAGLMTYTKYDDMNNIISISSQCPKVEEIEQPIIIEKTFEYDSNGNMTKAVDNGVTTTFTYDIYSKKLSEHKANGQNIFYEYDSYNRLTKEIITDKSDSATASVNKREVSYDFNTLNQLMSETNVFGKTAYYQYDIYGNQILVKDFNGLYSKNYYNKNNLLIKQIDQRGNASYKYYNSLNQLVEELTVNGAVNKYESDVLGNVIKVINGLNEETIFTYNMYGNVLSTKDELGNEIVRTYSPDGKVITETYIGVYTEIIDDQEIIVNKTINSISNEYNVLGLLINETTEYDNPLTQSTETIIKEYQYNVYGELTRTVDGRDYATDYTYSDHRLEQTIYPNGLVETNLYNLVTGELTEVQRGSGDNTRTEKFEYNIYGEVTKTTLANESFTEKTYENGLVTSESFSNDNLTDSSDDYIKIYLYNDNGQLITTKDNADYIRSSDSYNSEYQVLEIRDYNIYGDLISLTNQSGLETTYEYDRYGNLQREIKQNVVYSVVDNGVLTTSEANLVTTTEYDILNRPTKTVGTNGLVTIVEYNEINQIISKSTIVGDGDNAIINTESYELDMLDNLMKVTNSEGEETVNVYDGLGRLVKIVLANGEFTTTVYDSNNNVIEVKKNNGATGDANNPVHKQKQIFVYDEMNNLVQKKDIKNVDIEGSEVPRLVSYSYNEFNELIFVQQDDYSVSYSYDKMGNKIKTIYSNGSTITYDYNASNKLVKEEFDKVGDANSGNISVEEEYTYYIDGKLKTKTDNPPTTITETHGRRTNYYYYTNNQLTEHSIEEIILKNTSQGLEETSTWQTVNYTYNKLDQIVTMIDDEGSTDYAYNESGQLSSVTRDSSTVRYEYDKYGNQTKIINGNSTVEYTYDSTGRMTSVTDSNGVTSYTYDSSENKVTEELPNGTKTIKTYEFDQVKNLLITELNGGVETTVFTQELSYDEYGNLVEEKRVQNEISTTITNTYNDRDELEKSIHNDGTDYVVYSYNLTGLGNKTESIKYYNGEIKSENNYRTEGKSYSYNALNQVTKIESSDGTTSTTVNYFYDEYGNLIQEDDGQEAITYEYDLKNQLVSYTDGSETINFRYDGSGNRIEKKISSNNSVTDTVTYVNDITKPNEEVISLVHNGTTVNYTYGLDRLYEGNEEYLHDSFGNVIEHSSETYEYTPYGDLISGTIDNVNEYGYKGEVHDTESLQYLRARYYHTSLMQFISEDSYTGEDSNPLSQNRYTFVQNNPFKYSDPSGHSAMFEEKDGSVVTTPPTSTQKQDIPQQPKSEPAKTPSTTTSTYDHVDTTLNEFIHQQMNEDPFYGRINPYEEIEENAGIDPMNAYIHTYKNEHIKRGDPVSFNDENENISVSNDFTSNFYSCVYKSEENALGNGFNPENPLKIIDDNLSEIRDFAYYTGILAGINAGAKIAVNGFNTLTSSVTNNFQNLYNRLAIVAGTEKSLGVVKGSALLILLFTSLEMLTTLTGTGLDGEELSEEEISNRNDNSKEYSEKAAALYLAGEILGGINDSSKIYINSKLPQNTTWYNEDGTINYPLNDGAVYGTEENMTLEPGTILGRYGSLRNTSDYVTQPGVDPNMLSLPPYTDPSTYTEFEVIKPIPEVIKAEIMPWGDSVGGGIQYKLPMPIIELIKGGYLK